MGTPVPEPPLDYGDDCWNCTVNGGSLWEPGKTPLYLYFYFAGIKKCPAGIHTPPNGKTFKLTQKEGYPCIWEHVGSVWNVYFVTDPPGADNSRVVLSDPDGKYYFNSYGPGCPEETTIYTNECDCASPQCHGHEGVAVIHWMDIVLALVLSMSLPGSKPIMHELFVTGEDNIVHKFCHVKHGMNIKMLSE